jgi:hypothetical protein
MTMNPVLGTATPTMNLGVPGYLFSDLHDPERLASLYERFYQEVEAAVPELRGECEAHRAEPDAPRPPIALSNLLVALAPHVSRFLTPGRERLVVRLTPTIVEVIVKAVAARHSRTGSSTGCGTSSRPCSAWTSPRS